MPTILVVYDPNDRIGSLPQEQLARMKVSEVRFAIHCELSDEEIEATAATLTKMLLKKVHSYESNS